jgi:hypothetical protein
MLQRPPEGLDTSPPPERIGHAHLGHAGALVDGPPQVPISSTTLLHELRPWLKARVHRGVGMVAAGADAWAATELAGWLNQAAGSLPGHYWDIERDMSIHHDPDHRVALLFNRHTTDSPHPLLAVGVKAQSLVVTTAEFAQGVQAEVDRLRADALRPPFDAAERYVLALTLDAGGAMALLPLGFETRAALPTEIAIMWRAVRG